jgi:hypothetical protein
MSEEPEFDAKKFAKSYSSVDRFYQAVDIRPEALLRLRAEVLLDQYFVRLDPLRSALAKLEPATAPKPTPPPKAPPAVKADKRARR